MPPRLDPRRSAVLASAAAQALIAAVSFVLITVHGPRPAYFLFIALSGAITATLLCRVHGPLSQSRWLRGMTGLLWLAALVLLWKVVAKS